MRDELVDHGWWGEIRERLLSSIEDLESELPALSDGEGVDDEYWSDRLNQLCSYQYHLWQVDYSTGAPLEELAPRFEDLFHRWIPVMSIGVMWADSTRLVSIARLVGCTDEFHHFRRGGSVAERFKRGSEMVSQWMVDAPGAPTSGPAIDTTTDLTGRYWALINRASEAPAEATTDLVDYVRDWYELAHDYPWWGSHQAGRRGKPNGYVGYWCWEAAAIAKKCGIDDSALEGHKHYPYDLAHYLD